MRNGSRYRNKVLLESWGASARSFSAEFCLSQFSESGEAFMRNLCRLSVVFFFALSLTSVSVRGDDAKEKAAPPDQVKKAGAIFKAPGSYTFAVALTADGKLLARGGSDNTVDLWDVASGKKLHTLKGHTVPILRVTFSPDGKTLASITGSWLPDEVRGEVKLWDVATGKEGVSLEGHPTRGLSLAFSPDNKTLASAAGTVKLWDVSTGKERLELKLSKGRAGPLSLWNSLPWSLAFSPDGKTLATGTGGGIMDITPSAVILWDLAIGKERATLPGHSNSITWVGFAPDGKTLASASGAGGADKQGKPLPGEIKLWDVVTAKERATIPIRLVTPLQFFDLTFTADNKSLISATASFGETENEGGHAVTRWELAGGKARATFWAPFKFDGPPGAGTNAGVYFTALAADGKTVAWGGAEERDKKITGTAEVWEVQSLATSPPRLPNKAGKPPPKHLPEQAEGTFSLRVSAPATFVKPGETKTVALSIKRGKNFDEDVTLTFTDTDVPKGVTFEPANPAIKLPGTEAEFTIQAAKDAVLGDFAIKVTGLTAKGNGASDQFNLSVDPAGAVAAREQSGNTAPISASVTRPVYRNL
jgi:WD40 repeat protein